MKPEIKEKTYPFWICPECQKENRLKYLFCEKCGIEKPPENELIIKYRKDKHPLPIQKYEDNNLLLIDFIIIIVSVFISVIFFIYVANTNSFLKCLFICSLISFPLVLIAFIRLLICKTIKFWRRVTVFMISLFFNPITLLCLFFVAAMAFSEVSNNIIKVKSKFISKKSLAKACAEIVLQPNKYKNNYFKDFTNLPDFLRELNPSYITINKNCITIHKKKMFADYGWKFKINDNQKWNLYSFFYNESDLLISDIIINTNNGKVTIPWRFFK
ncbi:MAG: hypothetical protein ACTSXL_01335 [Alphaproteobacteria bacterium]